MSWIVLIVSGMLEAVWASALSASRGFTRPVPSVLFLVSLVASMLGLAWAMASIPTGTAYAVWVGIGATLTVLWSMAKGDELASPARLALITLLVACVAGLKVVA
ncbi:DMT family transporter [Janibacter limosus]|jgi:quaternary ammonium compound-resistance protein SugE|uniref:Multidrug efflux SMR transporter n=2 Tax=Janibacter limosus TaxID=53458 RepID=A0A4P6MUB5_9MICO|nr:multidrug efflux SMR transporter [Janibacter limosus]QBF45367.1 multidrug efflux SMR transporter [Janibacter limosus]